MMPTLPKMHSIQTPYHPKNTQTKMTTSYDLTQLELCVAGAKVPGSSVPELVWRSRLLRDLMESTSAPWLAPLPWWATERLVAAALDVARCASAGVGASAGAVLTLASWPEVLAVMELGQVLQMEPAFFQAVRVAPGAGPLGSTALAKLMRHCGGCPELMHCGEGGLIVSAWEAWDTLMASDDTELPAAAHVAIAAATNSAAPTAALMAVLSAMTKPMKAGAWGSFLSVLTFTAPADFRVSMLERIVRAAEEVVGTWKHLHLALWVLESFSDAENKQLTTEEAALLVRIYKALRGRNISADWGVHLFKDLAISLGSKVALRDAVPVLSAFMEALWADARGNSRMHAADAEMLASLCRRAGMGPLVGETLRAFFESLLREGGPAWAQGGSGIWSGAASLIGHLMAHLCSPKCAGERAHVLRGLCAGVRDMEAWKLALMELVEAAAGRCSAEQLALLGDFAEVTQGDADHEFRSSMFERVHTTAQEIKHARRCAKRNAGFDPAPLDRVFEALAPAGAADLEYQAVSAIKCVNHYDMCDDSLVFVKRYVDRWAATQPPPAAADGDGVNVDGGIRDEVRRRMRSAARHGNDQGDLMRLKRALDAWRGSVVV